MFRWGVWSLVLMVIIILFICRCQIILVKLKNPDHIAMTKTFDNNIIQKLGVPGTENDFDKDYLTPTYEYYDVTINTRPQTPHLNN